MKKEVLQTIVLLFLFFTVLPANAKIQLPVVLGDNMVLQQQSDVRLWGNAEPNKKVTIRTSWDGGKYTTQSDADGKWLVSVKTVAAGGPFQITISDGEKLTLDNVMLGEVWLCSGQSNMEMPVKGFSGQPIGGANDVIASADPRKPIRMITIDRAVSKVPVDSCKGTWRTNLPEAVANTSATAYFFAEYLNKVLDVPVGIVVSCWGGTQVEPWMSREALQTFPEVSLKHLDSDEKANPYVSGAVLQNAMIYPLRNLNIKGLIWYQGESNRTAADLYRRLMPAYVQDMRRLFDCGDFPFYYVQIAPYVYEGLDGISSAELREAQMLNMKDIPGSGMAVTMDGGEPYCIHPAGKKDVGTRLAWWALAKTYGKKGFSYSGPIFEKSEIKDGKVLIDFSYADGGLVISDAASNGFEISPDNKTFYPAQVKIIGLNRLEVSAPEVPDPVSARYCFRNYAVGTLFNTFGLPASSFRTSR